MSAVNKVILLGNLGKDPEVRYLEQERVRVSFSLATNETYKNKAGEKVTTTEWHNVVLWSSLAKIAAEYLTKGKQVYIEGKLVTRAYVDKEGQTKYITEVVGQHLVLLGGGSKRESVDVPEMAHETMDVTQAGADGLPF